MVSPVAYPVDGKRETARYGRNTDVLPTYCVEADYKGASGPLEASHKLATGSLEAGYKGATSTVEADYKGATSTVIRTKTLS